MFAADSETREDGAGQTLLIIAIPLIQFNLHFVKA